MTDFIDETLLEPRAVMRFEADAEGLGYETILSCGHSVWFPVQPPAQTPCGLCLDKLIHQARQVQEHQRPLGK